MAKDTKYIRGFHWNSQAWYWDSIKDKKKGLIDDIMFGVYQVKLEHIPSDALECLPEHRAEAQMLWEDLHSHQPHLDKKIVPILRLFDDSWHMMNYHLFRDLATIYGNRSISPEKFTEILKEHNFVDLTARERR